MCHQGVPTCVILPGLSRYKVLRSCFIALPSSGTLRPCSLPRTIQVAGHVSPSAIHAPGDLSWPFSQEAKWGFELSAHGFTARCCYPWTIATPSPIPVLWIRNLSYLYLYQHPRPVVLNLGLLRCFCTATPRNPSQHSWWWRLLGVAVQKHLSNPRLRTTGLGCWYRYR